jgi:hypothetical protein
MVVSHEPIIIFQVELLLGAAVQLLTLQQLRHVAYCCASATLLSIRS